MIKRTGVLMGMLGILSVHAAYAGSIQIAEAQAFVHANGALVTQIGIGSTGYFSTLDSNNLGTFGWSFSNTTASTLTNVNLFGFLDADIDRDLNTFFNEYGSFVGLSLPSDAPAGAIVASSWQIDEPGFVFGTILNDLAAGSLRNDNFVPSSSPDDVSLSLGFFIGDLAPGQSATVTMRLSALNLGGLQQFDPDSEDGFYLNGFATVSDVPTGNVPEPGSWVLCALGLSVVALARRKSA